jgi:hypothetical protein
MKKISGILIICFLPALVVQAQNDAISQLFDQYYNNDAFTKVSVSSKMFELFTKIEPGDADEEEVLKAISQLKGLKVLAADSIGNSKALYDEAVKKVSGNGYEELMEVKDASENMKFMIKEKDGIINELVTVVGGNKSFALISLYGVIDLKTISKLSKSMNIKGMEYLKNVDEKNEDKKQ